ARHILHHDVRSFLRRSLVPLASREKGRKRGVRCGRSQRLERVRLDAETLDRSCLSISQLERVKLVVRRAHEIYKAEVASTEDSLDSVRVDGGRVRHARHCSWVGRGGQTCRRLSECSCMG